MKFLVMWELNVTQIRTEMVHAVMRMPEYAKKLLDQDKLEKRYHVVGKHGGAWIYDVDSNEELDHLLAMAPVYNFAHYEVYPLAEMDTPATVIREPEAGA